MHNTGVNVFSYIPPLVKWNCSRSCSQCNQSRIPGGSGTTFRWPLMAESYVGIISITACTKWCYTECSENTYNVSGKTYSEVSLQTTGLTEWFEGYENYMNRATTFEQLRENLEWCVWQRFQPLPSKQQIRRYLLGENGTGVKETSKLRSSEVVLEACGGETLYSLY